jgi:hypothetical protein
MDGHEYICIRKSQLPQPIFDKQYELQDLVQNAYVYVEIRKRKYGLPQAGKLVKNELIPHLTKHSCHQCKCFHGLFTHDARPTTYSLLVDDFVVKYCIGRVWSPPWYYFYSATLPTNTSLETQTLFDSHLGRFESLRLCSCTLVESAPILSLAPLWLNPRRILAPLWFYPN